MTAARTVVAMAAVLAVLAACTDTSLRPTAAMSERAAATNDWVGAVRHYQAAIAKDPDDPAVRRGYHAAVEGATDYYLGLARRHAEREDFESAAGVLGQALFVMPDNVALASEMERVKGMRAARSLYRDAAAQAQKGRGEQALKRLEEAMTLDPDFPAALRLYRQVQAQQDGQRSIDPIRLRTGAPVTLNFRNADFKEAMLSLGEAYGVNIIFDSSLEDRSITLYAEDVSFTQALRLLLKSNRAFYRRLGKNSVVIAADTAEARAEYEDYIVRTFYIESGNATKIGELIGRSLGIQNVSIDEEAGTVTVRDSRDRVALAGQLVATNDRAPAEVVMEVEIIEVNRNKSENLGLDFGSQVTVTPPQLQVRDFRTLDGIGQATDASALSLPAVTLRYFKQDVDAKTLAAPRIRTVDRKEAQIHIGDKVPLRSSTVVDATGQTRDTFEYRDIGIKLTVTPQIKLNRSVVVDLALEVSSLGQNLGTADSPAFAIGTRNVSSRMVLEDGEVAIIGGLIRDEERKTTKRLPGFGKTSALGKLFSNSEGQGGRTDIILTLTPRIVRGPDIPSEPESEFFSGSGNRVTSDPVADFIAGSGSNQPTIRLDMSGEARRAAPAAPPALLPTSSAAAATPSGGGGAASLGFSRTDYEVTKDDSVDVVITARGLPDDVAGVVTVRFRPDLVEAANVSTGAGLASRIDNTKGQVEIDLTAQASGAGGQDLSTITFRALKPGLSYLIFSNSFGSGPNIKMPANIDLGASRIVVR
jgi:general secretion pathway protein D